MNWSEISDPKEGVSYYTHTILETPLGKAIIEWKGWKDRDDDKSITVDSEYIGTEITLENAKERVLQYLTGKSNQLITFLKKEGE